MLYEVITINMLEQYRKETDERNRLGVPPLPLSADQTRELVVLLNQGSSEQALLLRLLADRVEPGVSKAAEVKAGWLEQVAMGEAQVRGCSPDRITSYNVCYTKLLRYLGQPFQPLCYRRRKRWDLKQTKQGGDIIAAAHLRKHGNGILG